MAERENPRRVAVMGLLAVASVGVLVWSLSASGVFPARPRPKRPPPPRAPDVIYVPTPQPVVDQMLELAGVKPGDVLYDLGCGDGRIVVTAAKRYGIKAVGFDIDPRRVAEARENVRKNGVSDLATIREQDIFKADLSEATVVTMYLLEGLNRRLKPKLARLKPGSRIVSHSFPMEGARPKAVEKTRTAHDESPNVVYLWVVPWEVE